MTSIPRSTNGSNSIGVQAGLEAASCRPRRVPRLSGSYFSDIGKVHKKAPAGLAGANQTDWSTLGFLRCKECRF